MDLEIRVASPDDHVLFHYVEERERPEHALQRAQRALYVHAAGVGRGELDVRAFNEGARELYRTVGYKPWIERLALETG